MKVLWAAWAKGKAFALLLAGVGLALVGIYATGRRDAGAAAKVKDLKDYAKTRKAIDDATDNLGDDPAVLREWLSERGKP